MNYDQFFNLSCYEELEIQSTLLGISKVDVLKEIGCKIDDYYFFVSEIDYSVCAPTPCTMSL